MYADYFRWLWMYFGNGEKSERHAIKRYVPKLISISFNEGILKKSQRIHSASGTTIRIYYFVILYTLTVSLSDIFYAFPIYFTDVHSPNPNKTLETFYFKFFRFVSSFDVRTLCGKVFIDLIPRFLSLFFFKFFFTDFFKFSITI